jgi:hypothetical protein
LTWAKFFKHLSDLKLWAFCTLFMSTTVPVYAFAYFTPVILAGMCTPPSSITHQVPAPSPNHHADTQQATAPVSPTRSPHLLPSLP